MSVHGGLVLTVLVLFHSDVHNAEFVLTGVLTQTLDYESYPLRRCRAGTGEDEVHLQVEKGAPWLLSPDLSLAFTECTVSGPFESSVSR